MSFVVSAAALAVVYVLVGRLERTDSLRFRALSSPRPHLATDLAWFATAVGVSAVSAFVLQPVLSRVAIGPVAEVATSLAVPAQVLLSLVVFDAVSYAVHRQLHRSDLLWSVHKVHHSTLELDSLATTRTHLLENLLRFVPGQLVLFLIGMPVGVVAPTVAIAAIYGVSNHSNLDLRAPRLEALVVTPRLHRRHHVPATTNSNYGTILTIWDRLAGTFEQRDTTADERFGVPGEVDTYPQRFADAVREPLRAARRRRSAGLAPSA